MNRPQNNKPRVIKDFDKLDLELQEQIKLVYPEGFSTNLIKYQNREGQMVTALPFETDEKYYMVRMTVTQARVLVENDDDYDDLGNLKEAVKDEYEEKYSEIEYVSEYLSDDEDDDDDDDF
jgi:predicted S18 family serine protease